MENQSLEQVVWQQLQQVVDPELHRSVVDLEQVRDVSVDGAGNLRIELRPSRQDAATRQAYEKSVREVLAEVEGITQLEVVFSAGLSVTGNGGTPKPPPPPQEQARMENPMPQVKHIIAVGAGKGGVGKSMVAVNLAVGLARKGLSVGLLDGDIYGPSIPTMFGLNGAQPEAEGQTIIPFEAHGVKVMSVGFLVEDQQALIWRGPMAHGAFKQLATQTRWGVLDYLIVDLPPGTGDVCLTLAQTLPLTGAVVVCTPQKVAQDDALRAITMFRQLGIEVAGVVENMSWFIGDDGKEYDLFGKGGARALAEKEGVPFLGQVPINMALRRHSDEGDPSANFTQDAQLERELNELAAQVQAQVTLLEMAQ